MNDKICCSNDGGFKESVCIHTDKVYDSCRDKDCLENLRVYLTSEGQCLIDRAINVKCTKAEIIWVFSDIEAVPFQRGYYSVDLNYFIKVTLSVNAGMGKPTEIEGLTTFNKRVILFGSEGNAKVFESKYKQDAFDAQLWRKTNMPSAVVEVVDPVILGAQIVEIEKDKCCCGNQLDLASVPESVCRVFGDTFIIGGEQKRVYVSLGIFSIIRLQRKVMLLIPAYDFCIPNKECVDVGGTEENPCDIFDKICFPVDEFFPPHKCNFDSVMDNNKNHKHNCKCGCGK